MAQELVAPVFKNAIDLTLEDYARPCRSVAHDKTYGSFS